MLRILATTVIVIAILGGGLKALGASQEYAKVTKEDYATQWILREIASNANSSVPLRIDKYTVLTSVDVFKNQLVYRLKLNDMPSNYSLSQMKKFIYSEVMVTYCISPQLATIRYAGVSIVYQYRTDGSDLFTLVVHPDDCFQPHDKELAYEPHG